MNKKLEKTLDISLTIVMAPFLFPVVAAVICKGGGGGEDHGMVSPEMEKLIREVDENGMTMLERYYMKQGARVYHHDKGYLSYDQDGKVQIQPQ